jgi:hypothetical protein
MRQDSLIYTLKTGMNTIFNEKRNELMEEVMKINSKVDSHLHQTTNYNLNVICLNTNNLASSLDVSPCKTLPIEDLKTNNSLHFNSEKGEQGGEN